MLLLSGAKEQVVNKEYQKPRSPQSEADVGQNPKLEVLIQ